MLPHLTFLHTLFRNYTHNRCSITNCSNADTICSKVKAVIIVLLQSGRRRGAPFCFTRTSTPLFMSRRSLKERHVDFWRSTMRTLIPLSISPQLYYLIFVIFTTFLCQSSIYCIIYFNSYTQMAIFLLLALYLFYLLTDIQRCKAKIQDDYMFESRKNRALKENIMSVTIWISLFS